MHKHPVALLGVSFDNGTLEESAKHIITLALLHEKDPISRYVCTINTDFLATTHSINWNSICNLEVLDLYRKSQVVLSDGKPLVWLSWLLGSPLKERVTGIDLLPKIAAALGEKKRSIFLLGGQEHINKIAALILEAQYPELRVTGHLSPIIYTEGEELVNCDELDSLLVEEINRHAPDVLFIALGNPKQEKWFFRIQDRLHVPISIGVGGSLDIIAGAYSRAPLWMQKAGLEWLFRLFQEPQRLWKRYLFDLLKFLGISIPLVIYHSISRFKQKLKTMFGSSSTDLVHPLLFLSKTQTIAIVPLPQLIDVQYCHIAHTRLDETFNQDTVILDFENVSHITLEGFSLLLKIWNKAARKGKELYAMNLSGDIKLLMKLHRIWDLIKDSVMNTPQQVLRALIQGKQHPDYFDSIQQNDEVVVIYFFGRIGGEQNQSEYIDKLLPVLKDKNCILDFRYCTHIENAGFAFLLKLKKSVELNNHRLYITKCKKSIERLFYLNKLDHLFEQKP